MLAFVCNGLEAIDPESPLQAGEELSSCVCSEVSL